MNIRFLGPKAGGQVGGIESAMNGLSQALQNLGVSVIPTADVKDAEAVHHFHGLWNFNNSKLGQCLRLHKRSYVVSPHGMLEPWAFRHRGWKKIPYFWLVERGFLLGAKRVFVTSRMESDNFRLILPQVPVEVLPLGCIDRRGPDFKGARQRLGWGKDEKVLLFLSRIDKKKGLDLLLAALNGRSDWSGWRLVIVGDGDPDYLASLKDSVDKANRNLPRIEWIGPIWGEARWAYLQGSDLLCLPTYSENFGLVVLEALHVGTPVLTTDQTPWVDDRGLQGLFIAKPNVLSIQAELLNARTMLARGWLDSDRKSLALWAADKFSWHLLGPSYTAAYRRALSS
ncbi:MAG: glycosyltransferase [Verrucomicrobiales bacterium]|nr:glycosyltransferase [Verrucomicrobiales bacterium]